MANLQQLLTLPPLSADNIVGFDEVPTIIPEDVKELQADTLNVIEGRVDIHTFTEERQNVIRSYWRFSATRYLTKYPKIARRTRETLDVV